MKKSIQIVDNTTLKKLKTNILSKISYKANTRGYLTVLNTINSTGSDSLLTNGTEIYGKSNNSFLRLNESTRKWSTLWDGSAEGNTNIGGPSDYPIILYHEDILLLSSNGIYKWSGESWILSGNGHQKSGSTYNRAVVYKDKIRFFTQDGSSHQVYEGGSWVNKNSTPTAIYGGVVVYNDELHLIGGITGSTLDNRHFKWNASTDLWEQLPDIPTEVLGTGNTPNYPVVYKDHIYVRANNTLVRWGGGTWENIGATLVGPCIIYNNEILAKDANNLLSRYDGVSVKLYGDYSLSPMTADIEAVQYYLTEGSFIYCDPDDLLVHTKRGHLESTPEGYRIPEDGLYILNFNVSNPEYSI